MTEGRFSHERLLRAGVIALVASVAASMVVRTVTVHVVSVPASFAPLHSSSVIGLTVLGVLAAVFTCTELDNRVAAPVKLFRRIAHAALLLSFIPAIGIWIGHSNPGTRAATIIPLWLMQLTVASVCVVLLPTLGAAAPSGRTSGRSKSRPPGVGEFATSRAAATVGDRFA